jgi:hypothetical protein
MIDDDDDDYLIHEDDMTPEQRGDFIRPLLGDFDA